MAAVHGFFDLFVLHFLGFYLNFEDGLFQFGVCDVFYLRLQVDLVPAG
jgi:hypothetical protein